MAEYSKIARGTYTSVASLPQNIYLPFQPQVVKVQINTNLATPTNGNKIYAYWDKSMPQDTALITSYNTTGTSPGTAYQRVDRATSMAISTFSKGVAGRFGPQQQVVSATAANPIVFTVNSHGYLVGDVVMFEGLYQSATTGMAQICGMPFTIATVPNANSFSITWNGTGSNYTALSGSPLGAYVKKVLDPYLYSPGVYFISAIAASGTQLQITTTTQNNLVVGSEVSFRIPRLWGSVQLNYDMNTPGATLYGIVTSVVSGSVVPGSVVIVNINPSYINTFTVNIPVIFVPGLSFPQMVTAGDINNGGGQATVNGISTMNGPTVSGAFINNSRSGFTVGLGIVQSGSLSVSWEALYFDLTING